MRGAGLIVLVIAALLAVTRYEPRAGSRLSIEPVGAPAEAPAVRYSGSFDPDNIPSILPPEHFTGSVGALTLFVSRPEMNALCGAGNLACVRPRKTGERVMILPNPCPLQVSRVEAFAAITCHEIGHINGWVGEHGP